LVVGFRQVQINGTRLWDFDIGTSQTKIVDRTVDIGFERKTDKTLDIGNG
jgi:hypothetical protein